MRRFDTMDRRALSSTDLPSFEPMSQRHAASWNWRHAAAWDLRRTAARARRRIVGGYPDRVAVGPAYRIVTERLVLRCFEPRDAAPLKAAVDASLDQLVPWLPWAREEPQPLDAKVELVRQFRGKFDLGKDFVFGIFDREERALIGGTGMHARVGQGAREIGYWIASAHAGQGFATEAAAALTRVGFEIEKLERMEIHCDSLNVRSAAIPRKLGYTHDGTLRARLPRSDGGMGERMIWSMLPDEFAASACGRFPCEAFDAIGRRILERPNAAPRRRSAFN
jgi:RimJ/RimL family protein N-acetyltransferase